MVAWILERIKAIKRGDTRLEYYADQSIHRGFQLAANTFHPHSPQGVGFQNVANAYVGSSYRTGRNNILWRILKGAIIKKAVAAVLLGASVSSIPLLAPAATYVLNGTQLGGYMINNGNGTSEFVYDADGNGFVDHQILLNNVTYCPMGPAEALGPGSALIDVFHELSSLFPF
ncbi:hypothetical protein FRC09_007186 [Ceratobasidium sp. 395]|nr:hypothetical protein FRC09_007186 [Ceratobasidium sp. 395]